MLSCKMISGIMEPKNILAYETRTVKRKSLSEKNGKEGGEALNLFYDCVTSYYSYLFFPLLFFHFLCHTDVYEIKRNYQVL